MAYPFAPHGVTYATPGTAFAPLAPLSLHGSRGCRGTQTPNTVFGDFQRMKWINLVENDQIQ